MSGDCQRDDFDPFLTNVVGHQGYRLALRVRPKVDTADHRSRFARLLMLIHELAEVRSNGLPESEYNQSLAGYDRDVFRFVESEGDGMVALVEVFGGKRTYYAYVRADANFKARFAELKAKYPQHVVSAGFRDEPDWRTFELYRRLYPW